MEKELGGFVEITESSFKALAWTALLALLASSLKGVYHDANYVTAILGTVIFILMSVALCFWVVFKVSIPLCNVIYPSVRYIEALNLIESMPSRIAGVGGGGMRATATSPRAS